MERWKPVAGWDGYEVSTEGRVRSFKKSRRTPDEPLPRLLRGYVLPNGYTTVDLKNRGLRRRAYVHRLVLETFVGQAPDGREAAHNNGVQSDNRLANLRWATPEENTSDKVRHGTVVSGVRHWAARLSADEASELREFDGSHSQAARAFGVPYHVAYNVRTGRTYRND